MLAVEVISGAGGIDRVSAKKATIDTISGDLIWSGIWIDSIEELPHCTAEENKCQCEDDVLLCRRIAIVRIHGETESVLLLVHCSSLLYRHEPLRTDTRRCVFIWRPARPISPLAKLTGRHCTSLTATSCAHWSLQKSVIISKRMACLINTWDTFTPLQN